MTRTEKTDQRIITDTPWLVAEREDVAHRRERNGQSLERDTALLDVLAQQIEEQQETLDDQRAAAKAGELDPIAYAAALASLPLLESSRKVVAERAEATRGTLAQRLPEEWLPFLGALGWQLTAKLPGDAPLYVALGAKTRPEPMQECWLLSPAVHRFDDGSLKPSGVFVGAATLQYLRSDRLKPFAAQRLTELPTRDRSATVSITEQRTVPVGDGWEAETFALWASVAPSLPAVSIETPGGDRNTAVMNALREFDPEVLHLSPEPVEELASSTENGVRSDTFAFRVGIGRIAEGEAPPFPDLDAFCAWLVGEALPSLGRVTEAKHTGHAENHDALTERTMAMARSARSGVGGNTEVISLNTEARRQRHRALHARAAHTSARLVITAQSAA